MPEHIGFRLPTRSPGVAVAQHDPMGGAEHPRVQEFAQRWGLEEPGVRRLTARLTAVTDGKLKLVRRDGEEFLYDLERDPGETAPLRSDTGDEAVALSAALEHPSVLATAPSMDVAAASDSTAEELAVIEQQMKLLGYM